MRSLKFLVATTAFLGAVSYVSADHEQSAKEAKDRLDGVAQLFAKHGSNTFNVLNGVARGGSGSEQSSKGGSSNIADAEILKSDDPKASLFCVKNGNWAVRQSRPLDVNKNAMGEHDASGEAIVQKMISALRNSSDGTATVEYTTATDGVKDPATGADIKEKRVVLLYRSDKLLGKKNDTGDKFFCGTTFHKS